MRVETALHGGGGNGEFEGSWYAASVVGAHREGLLLDFDEVAGIPAEEAAFDALRAVKVSGYDAIRPMPPSTPAGFDKMVELGLGLELAAEGGWWEVELLGVSGGAWVEPVPFDPSRELGVGSRVRVAKRDSEFDGQCGVVAACSDGWMKAHFDGGATKHFRSAELVHMVGDDGDNAAAGHGNGSAADGAGTTAYTVRLISAMTEDEGLYTVGVEELRPGWTWRLGKWCGKWKAQMKKGHEEREAEKEAAFGRLQAEWAVGARVEVLQSDDGMQGSWFDAEIIEHQYPDRCVVRYSELHEGDDGDNANVEERGPDWWPPLYTAPEAARLLRPLPLATADAPEQHVAWAATLAPGAAADLRYDGGWWEVEVMEVLHPPANGSGGAEADIIFVVNSVHFEVTHRVLAAELRPPHTWEPQAGCWGASGSWALRPPPEVYHVGGVRPKPAERGKKSGKKSEKPSSSEPKEKPSCFAVGTKRRGTDGAQWEVGYARLDSLTQVWVPLVGVDASPPAASHAAGGMASALGDGGASSAASVADGHSGSMIGNGDGVSPAMADGDGTVASPCGFLGCQKPVGHRGDHHVVADSKRRRRASSPHSPAAAVAATVAARSPAPPSVPLQ